MKKKAVIFGITDFAQVASVYLRDDAGYTVEAFTVNREYVNAPSMLDIPIVAFEDLANSYPAREFDMFCAIGFSKVNANRRAVYNECVAKGYSLPAYVNSNVRRWKETSIGNGSFIFENNVIQPFVSVGENCVFWSGNHIGHHSQIGSHVFIASHVVISGHCTIGDNCFLGVNATLRDGITVGKDSVIGAGALLLKDAAESSVYKGAATEPQARRSDELRKF